jgi:hypothetical protein
MLFFLSILLIANIGKAAANPQYLIDYDFGCSQVDAMMQDRPRMRQLVLKSDKVYSWVARQFGGAACGQKIYWNREKLAKPDKSEYVAENQFPTNERIGFIRVREVASNGKALTSDELWNSAIFELINISYGPKYFSLSKRAITQKLSKEQYISEATKLEYEASKRTIDVYYFLWLPSLKKNGLVPKPWPSVPATYEDWIKRFKSKSGYPWDSWGKYYDDELKPFILLPSK